MCFSLINQTVCPQDDLFSSSVCFIVVWTIPTVPWPLWLTSLAVITLLMTVCRKSFSPATLGEKREMFSCLWRMASSNASLQYAHNRQTPGRWKKMEGRKKERKRSRAGGSTNDKYGDTRGGGEMKEEKGWERQEGDANTMADTSRMLAVNNETGWAKKETRKNLYSGNTSFFAFTLQKLLPDFFRETFNSIKPKSPKASLFLFIYPNVQIWHKGLESSSILLNAFNVLEKGKKWIMNLKIQLDRLKVHQKPFLRKTTQIVEGKVAGHDYR